MLAVAISLEFIAFAAMFGFGGLSLGLSALALTVAVLLLSFCLDRRQARRARRRMWVYYALNDRFGDRAHARALMDPAFSRAPDPRRWIYLAPSLRTCRPPASRFRC